MCQPQGCVALRLLLDENIPVQLKAVFSGHLVKSVNDSDLGWKNIKNGRLLLEMEGSFDLLVTADRNMFAQQNPTGRNICILVCRSTAETTSWLWASVSPRSPPGCLPAHMWSWRKWVCFRHGLSTGLTTDRETARPVVTRDRSREGCARSSAGLRLSSRRPSGWSLSVNQLAADISIAGRSTAPCWRAATTPAFPTPDGNRVNVAEAGFSPRVVTGRASTRVRVSPATDDFAWTGAKSRGWQG
jgi:predicted nuclease of predicted toxin-antitoxin system